MKLRRACLDDYGIIKALYDDLSAEMIYVRDEPPPPRPDVDAEDFGWPVFPEFTIDVFKDELGSDSYYYFVITEGLETIGFFKAIKYTKEIRIGLWCMDKKYQHLKDEAWDKFLKTKEIRNRSDLSVGFFPSMVESRKWFESKGFVKRGVFWHLERKKRD